MPDRNPSRPLELEFQDYLLKERFARTKKNATVSAASEVSVTFLTALLLGYLFDQLQIALWVIFSLMCSYFSWRSHAIYNKRSSGNSVDGWTLQSVITTFFVGFAWGLAPVFFYAEDNTYYLVILVCFYSGYISGALSVGFAHAPSFLAFSSGITLPFAGRMFYEDDNLTDIIGWLSIFYVVCLTFVCKNMHELFIKSARNQFDNKLLVEELAEKNKTVERAVASKDRFLAAASHDLRQPLNAINLFLDALEPVQSTSLGKEILGKMKQSLKGLNGMLHSILDISKLDAAAVQNQPKHVSLKPIVTQLIDEYSVRTKHLEVSDELVEDVTVFCDPTLLYRILRNVFDNAVKYTQEGDISWEATIDAMADEKSVVLTLRDTGMGIPEDKISTVFDEFEQLNNPERNREKGLGLGLAIVRRLCKIAKVNINISSELGKGTSVTFVLPVGIASQREQTTEPQEFALNGKLVAVIDDEEDILYAMQRVISAWGCEVIVGDSQSAVLSALAKQPSIPDIIISDLRLAGDLDGRQVIEAIREEYNNEIPAVIVTGDTSPSRIDAVRNSGYSVAYKPIDSSELKVLVQSELNSTGSIAG